MIRILNELPHYCEDCPNITLSVSERLGSGALAYTCNHLCKCARVYNIAKKERSKNDISLNPFTF